MYHTSHKRVVIQFISDKMMINCQGRNLILWLLVLSSWSLLCLQSAPVELPPNWTVRNSNAQFQPQFSSSDSTYTFGFLTSAASGRAALVIAIPSCNPLPTCNGDFQIVWIANRNVSVGHNATLALTNGNLVLRDNDSSHIWSTNLSPGDTITSVEMQVDGNLVMRDARGRALWESFSHPTDTLLPGQVLRYKMDLVAGISPSSSSEGSYRMVMEPKALVLYTNAQPYWIFPEMTHEEALHDDANTTFAYVVGSNLNVCDGSVCSAHHFGGFNSSSLSFLRLGHDGVLRWYFSYESGFKRMQWTQLTVLADPCLYPASCGPYGVCSDRGYCTCPSGGLFRPRNAFNHEWQGCDPRWNAAACHDLESGVDVFEVGYVTYFSNRYLAPAANDASLDDCRNMCLGSCACAAAFWSEGECFLVQDSVLSLTSGRYTAFIKYIGRKDAEDSLKVAVRVLGVALGVLVFAFVVAIIVVRSNSLRCAELDDAAFLKSLRGVPPRFTVQEMEVATKGFHKVLGEGGFGKVYAGVLPDGSKVAVKRLSGSRQGHREFWAEVATIGSINHLRLVRLCGFCCEGVHRMLVYECMDNGSLDQWLFNDGIPLPWRIRCQVAVDTAEGLVYLHRDCRQRIIHLDVKPQNILLDGEFRAKVADFGMSMIFHEEMTEVVTRMRGTPGYLAPEWLLQTGITSKCDVYSYGMVLLEIVSGRKNTDVKASLEKWYFPAWAVQRMQENSWKEIVDVRLVDGLTPKEWAQVKRMVKIALWCIQDSPKVRPTMATVLQMLEGAVKVADPPLQFEFVALCSKTQPVISTHSSLTRGSEEEELPSAGGVEFPESHCKQDADPDNSGS